MAKWIKENWGGLLVWAIIIGAVIYFNSNRTYSPGTFKRESNFAKNDVASIIDYDCSDFKTQKEVQEFFKKSGGPKEDYYHFDANGDGQACDTYKYGAKPDKKCLEESIAWEDNHLKELGYTKQSDDSWKNQEGNYPTSDESNTTEAEMTDVYNHCLEN